MPLFLGNMPENERELFYYANMRESIGALKGTIHKYKRKGTSIGRIIPAEYYPYIVKCNNDMEMVIQSAEIQLNMPQILNIFPKVENKSQPCGLTTGSAGGLDEPLRGIFRYRL